MEINLNNEEFKNKEFSIFNDGKAGVVYGVRFKTEKKKSDDTTNAPDYNLFFIDDKGEVKKPFWYITKESMERNPKVLVNQGMLIRHMWHAAKGKQVEIPNFQNPVDMLDKTMAMLNEASRFTANVIVDYGDNYKHLSFLEVTRFAPFMEIDVNKEESKLRLRKNAKLERLVEDNPAELSINSTSSGSDLNWD